MHTVALATAADYDDVQHLAAVSQYGRSEFVPSCEQSHGPEDARAGFADLFADPQHYDETLVFDSPVIVLVREDGELRVAALYKLHTETAVMPLAMAVSDAADLDQLRRITLATLWICRYFDLTYLWIASRNPDALRACIFAHGDDRPLPEPPAVADGRWHIRAIPVTGESPFEREAWGLLDGD